MYNDSQLQLMTPRMTVEYRIEPDFLTNGTFDNIPENAFGAHIGASFPVVNADGEFNLSWTSYDLYVGKVFELKKLLEQTTENNVTTNEALKEQIKEYEKAGITNVVSTKWGIFPLRYGDAVFSTQEEMATAIATIDRHFKSVNISVQNAEIPRFHK